MQATDLKKAILEKLRNFRTGDLLNNAKAMLNTLGYYSDKTVELSPNTPANFIETFARITSLNADKALLKRWRTVDLIFQLTDEELNLAKVSNLRKDFDPKIYQSYLFIAIELEDDQFSRTKLVAITREVNKLFAMPVMVFFKSGGRLTVSIINRRPNKRETSKDVLEKVTLIKDINLEKPHRAHIEILHDLALPNLAKHKIANFLDLHNAWQKTLDTSELNKKFYREIADWYFWAMQQVAFPDDAEKDPDIRNATSLIRLITRLIFVWFLKEKGLVPEQLFDQNKVDRLLTKTDKTGSTYYKAILQNLFFATLNTPMNRDKPGSRKFVNGQYLVHTFYRYKRYFKDEDAALKLFEDIPFLNGGLFECLDRKDDDSKEIRIDCFSENPKHETRLKVPDELFFGDEQTIDLSQVFGDKRRSREKVRGILRILDSYKFTVAENTPLEEEVALDPELLGKVFENLLASYNPETKTTARKQTGSFYTPREIVNYMVDESLIAYLKTKLQACPEGNRRDAGQGNEDELEKRLRHLFEYTDEPHQFSPHQVDLLINAIDACKILDPACGSGAFPMGILHRLVHLLGKLDPHNRKWKQRQIDKVQEIPDVEVREQLLEDVEKNFEENELDYGRKLYLIENCIYGVDIQPIACQIAKLRFFISLVVEQQADRSRPNLGIRPLPNLETRFVAANTLIGLDKGDGQLEDLEVKKLKAELKEVRHRHFTARTYATKEKYRQKDKEIRQRLKELLQDAMNPEIAAKIAGWNPYDQNASADFFDREWMFGIRDGFDVVIGNPPYVDIKQLSDEIVDFIFEKFSTAHNRINLYAAFIERASLFLSRKGMLTFINPNSLLVNSSYKKLRRLIVDDVTKIIKLPDGVFSAVIETMILICQSNNKEKEIQGACYKSSEAIDFQNIRFGKFKRKEWIADRDTRFNVFVSSELKNVLNKIESNSTVLSTICDFCLGITPYDKYKGHTQEMIKERVFHATEKLDDRYVPLISGKNILRYYVVPTPDEYLMYGDWLGAPRQKRFFQRPRIIVRQIVSGSPPRIYAGHTEEELYHTQVGFVVLPKKENQGMAKFICGILNSKLMNVYHKFCYLDVEKETFQKILIENCKKFPIKEDSCSIQNRITELVNQICHSKQQDPSADTRALENQIDLMVYKLYGLTWPEVKIVDPEFTMSEAEYEAVQLPEKSTQGA